MLLFFQNNAEKHNKNHKKSRMHIDTRSSGGARLQLGVSLAGRLAVDKPIQFRLKH
jgi:hypothetical protein